MPDLRTIYRTQRSLDRFVSGLRARLRGLVSRYVVGAVSSDAGDVARCRGTTWEAHDDDEQLQQYGFASRPPNGAEGVRLSVGADSAHGVVLCCDDRRYRPTLQEGEVASYHRSGARVRFLDNGDVEVLPGPGGTVHIGANPGAELVALAASTKARLDTLQAAFDAHTHAYIPGTLASAPTATPAPIGPLGPIAATITRAS